MYCVDHVVLWHESNADTDQKINAQSKLNSFNWEKTIKKELTWPSIIFLLAQIVVITHDVCVQHKSTVEPVLKTKCV